STSSSRSTCTSCGCTCCRRSITSRGSRIAALLGLAGRLDGAWRLTHSGRDDFGVPDAVPCADQCATLSPDPRARLLERGATPGARRLRAAMQLCTGLYTGSGKPTLAHEVGTASLALRHGGSFELVAAGLLHGAYIVGDFGHSRLRVTAAKR